MPATLKGIVVAAQSKIIRRFVIPDEDGQLDRHVGPGELMITVPIDADLELERARDAVERATGVRPPDHRCAVVDQAGNVVAVICADPALDDVPGHTLHLHRRARAGWKRSGGQWVEPAAEQPASLGSAVRAAVQQGVARQQIIDSAIANGHALADVLRALDGGP